MKPELLDLIKTISKGLRGVRNKMIALYNRNASNKMIAVSKLRI
jgi:hypothetical protein